MTGPGHARFQEDFAQALLGHAAAAPAPWSEQPAFAVYRNTVMKGCIDALEANYPSVARLVGRDWFRSAAALFVAASPPQDSSLFNYGEFFADFLRDFEPAAQLDYLPGVARLDRFWTEAHVAANAPVLHAAQLAELPPEDLASCHLQPHPAARWAWFAEQPVYSIWERNWSQAEPQDDLPWHAEGVLLTRPHASVHWLPASQAACAFLDACAAGQPFGAAVEQAQLADPSADFMAVLGQLLSAGAIQALSSPDMEELS